MAATSPVQLEKSERDLCLRALAMLEASLRRAGNTEPDPEIKNIRARQAGEVLALQAKFR